MDMNQANILVCDDEVEVADLLKHVLEREGFAVTCCHSGDAALTLLNAQVFDLAILDIMMPGIDGFEVCRQIRGGAAGSNTDMPIVFLSAKTEEFDKVLGFTLGADDYVTKPFKARELVARLKARLRGRSAAPAPSDVLSVSGIELDETTIRRPCTAASFLLRRRNSIVWPSFCAQVGLLFRQRRCSKTYGMRNTRLRLTMQSWSIFVACVKSSPRSILLKSSSRPYGALAIAFPKNVVVSP